MISDGNHTIDRTEAGNDSPTPTTNGDPKTHSNANGGPRIKTLARRDSKSKRATSKRATSKPSRNHRRSSTNGEKAHVPHASRLYHNLVPAYQAFWPAIARKRIAAGIASLDIPVDASVLEVGVGTGLSLDSYPSDVDITGVDLSESMLAEATQLIRSKQYDRVKVLPMNAEQLEFDDCSFDVVTSFHTITVVSNPRKMMSEIVRVCKPGGQILIINHFRSDNPLIARVVDSAGNITKRLGWRTDLELSEVVREFPLVLDDRYKPNPLSLFTIMKATCTKQAT